MLVLEIIDSIDFEPKRIIYIKDIKQLFVLMND